MAASSISLLTAFDCVNIYAETHPHLTNLNNALANLRKGVENPDQLLANANQLFDDLQKEINKAITEEENSLQDGLMMITNNEEKSGLQKTLMPIKDFDFTNPHTQQTVIKHLQNIIEKEKNARTFLANFINTAANIGLVTLSSEVKSTTTTTPNNDETLRLQLQTIHQTAAEQKAPRSPLVEAIRSTLEDLDLVNESISVLTEAIKPPFTAILKPRLSLRDFINTAAGLGLIQPIPAESNIIYDDNALLNQLHTIHQAAAKQKAPRLPLIEAIYSMLETLKVNIANKDLSMLAKSIESELKSTFDFLSEIETNKEIHNFILLTAFKQKLIDEKEIPIQPSDNLIEALKIVKANANKAPEIEDRAARALEELYDAGLGDPPSPRFVEQPIDLNQEHKQEHKDDKTSTRAIIRDELNKINLDDETSLLKVHAIVLTIHRKLKEKPKLDKIIQILAENIAYFAPRFGMTPWREIREVVAANDIRKLKEKENISDEDACTEVSNIIRRVSAVRDKFIKTNGIADSDKINNAKTNHTKILAIIYEAIQEKDAPLESIQASLSRHFPSPTTPSPSKR